MPRQNRVDPYGDLVATPERGTFMGNRGCLHNAEQQIVRAYQSRRWIICVLDFKARTRLPMPPGCYTSLFFLDEATALAAGHRPCAECRYAQFTAFRAHWNAAHPAGAGSAPATADSIDTILHSERISDRHFQRDKTKLTYTAQLSTLPDGVFVAMDGNPQPYLVRGAALYPWHVGGYRAPIARPSATVQVLTPPSTVRTIAHGYTPAMHPTAQI